MKKKELSETEVFDSLIYSLVDTAKLLKERGLTNPGTSKSGIIVLIDEADRASEELDLGALLKQLTEQLLFEGCNIISFIVSGLPEAVVSLRKSHESSLRVFDQINLPPLTANDCKEVIKLALDHANRSNQTPVTIADSALTSIASWSEGYPHFLQQFAYSAYEYDSDNNIDDEDFKAGSFKALGLIGDRYYKDMYYGKIKKDSYRLVLQIMSEKFNSWVTKEEIRSKFKGDGTTLNNAINALLERNIILRNPATRGEYRLQWFGFALWIKYLSGTNGN